MNNKDVKKSRTIAVAPMMDWTDRHFRYFMRLISKRCMLYTEMITTNAILQGKDSERFLAYDQLEHPITIQLGGNNPKDLVECAKISESHGYDEINLNVGCPSDRVSSGQFGLSLMANPQLVCECVDQMKQAVSIPVSVKTRIGFDNEDSFEQLHYFIDLLDQVNVDYICIHARKGWLHGLSPKENRTVPPLDYQRVYQIKALYPHLSIGINGGITTLKEAEAHLKEVDSVMIGRAAYNTPYLFSDVDQRFFDEKLHQPERMEIMENLFPYVEKELANGTRLHHITRHILGLFQGMSGARQFRRYLSEHAPTVSDVDILKNALKFIERKDIA
ncbi:tRNA dihydrouridine(20/20a) synthase DusA [Thiotrichales bacterium 19S9-12]|nr:tRNA dihydrouridine(20/20a) synthase DusA [Thiotrichales bacterium 19S9-11]MCF6812383.1 tRNA dihydrouridine(20/20a) synthase DusA [Thiotrichales bacterium 19S9-12]